MAAWCVTQNCYLYRVHSGKKNDLVERKQSFFPESNHIWLESKGDTGGLEGDQSQTDETSLARISSYYQGSCCHVKCAVSYFQIFDFGNQNTYFTTTKNCAF